MGEQTQEGTPTIEPRSNIGDEEKSGETRDQRATREFARTLKQNTIEYWSHLSTSGRRKYIGASVLSALAIGAGVGLMGKSEHSQEQVEENTSTTEEVGAGSIFFGVGEERDGLDLDNNRVDERAETGEEDIERDVTKAEESEEIITREIITQPNGTEITKEWHSPYAYTRTVVPPDTSSEPEPVYKEASSEPLAPIDHEIYEHITGTSYEDFFESVKEMAPEISGEPYDAEDVVEGMQQRSIVTIKEMDPRYIEAALHPDNETYQTYHEAFKQVYEGGDMPLPEIERSEVNADQLTHRETFSGEVSDPPDLNVSRARSFTLAYDLRIVRKENEGSSEVVPVEGIHTQYVRQFIPGLPETSNGIYVARETEQPSDK